MTDYQPLIARAIEGLGKSTGEARRGLYERARSALVAVALRRAGTSEVRDTPASACRSKRRSAKWRRTPRASRAWKRAPSRASNPARSSRQVVRLPPQCRRRPRPHRLPRPHRGRRCRPLPNRRSRKPSRPPKMSHHSCRTISTSRRTRTAAPTPPPPPRPIPSTARGRLLSARAPSLGREGLKGFRDVVHDVDDLGSASARAAQSARDTRDTYEPQPRRLLRGDDPPPGRYEVSRSGMIRRPR